MQQMSDVFSVGLFPPWILVNPMVFPHFQVSLVFMNMQIR